MRYYSRLKFEVWLIRQFFKGYSFCLLPYNYINFYQFSALITLFPHICPKQNLLIIITLMKKRALQNVDQNYLSHNENPLRQRIMVRSKQNSDFLPLFIMPDHRIVVFTQSPIYKRIYHHLKSICEPLYRPRMVHQYKITKFSLYTAMVLHYTGQQIVQILKRLSKNQQFPQSLQTQIIEYMKHAGQIRFMLINGEYYLFTTEEISYLVDSYIERIEDVTIKDIHLYHLDEISEEIDHLSQPAPQFEEMIEPEQIQYDEDGNIIRKQERQKQTKRIEKQMIKFKIIGDYFEVTKKLIQKNLPIVQQFDFKNCTELQNIEIDMNTDVQLRFYQQLALKNVFIDGKARSGLIILPCGAGKSMVAIELIQRIKKKAVIFCENQTSSIQWKEEFVKWTTIQRNKIVILTSKYKNFSLKQIETCSIFITTYSMVGLKRDKQNKFLQKTQSLPWGVCIADQVHKLPADTFQQVLRKYKFYLKIGLTATPYRQDNKIDNLYYMVGPKLYQENWLDLVNEGCLAKPYCVQILCQMPPMFQQSYRKFNRAELIHTANPQKFKVLQYLIKKHSHYGDKILVFCDRPKLLQRYAKLLNKPFIHGGVSQQQRLHFYGAFKTIKQFNVLFLSRVGDTAIDLPCANVGIQIGMHYKSRRQEVQRMGRIMRPKDNPFNEFNAFFYTLVSTNTDQAEFCRQRQKILIDQGFQHEIKISDQLNYSGLKIMDLDEKQHLVYVLSEHEEGNLFINRGQLFDNRRTTQIREGNMQEYNDYYYEQNDD